MVTTKISLTDDLVRVSEANQILPAGVSFSPVCWWRWHSRGVNVNGKTVKLPVLMIGKTPFTSRAAVEEFFQHRTEALHHPSFSKW